MFWKISQNSQGSPMPEPFFNKAAGFGPQNFPNFLRKSFLIEHL